MNKVGDWVRWYGELVRILSFQIENDEVVGPLRRGAWVEREYSERHFVERSWELCEALPRQGEWWRNASCVRHGGGCTTILEDGLEVDGIQWSVDAGDPWRPNVVCGCLSPLNFGKGPAAEIRRRFL